MQKENIQLRNNVQVIGNGEQTILFAHGFGCDQQVWHRIVPALEEEYRIILFDYVGSGYSDKTAYQQDRYASTAGYVKDVLEICEAFELKDIIFVGHSISGVIGMLAAIERPEIFKKLCMIGSSPRYINEPGYMGGFDEADIDDLIEMMERNYKEWAQYLAPIASKNTDRPALTEEFEGYLMANDRQIVKHFCEMTFKIDVREQLGKIETPSLLLQAQDDTIVPYEISEYMHEKMKNSELVLMNATGHNPHLSAPEEVIRFLKVFIQA